MPTLMAILTGLLLSARVLGQADEEMMRLRGTWYLLSTADERRTDPGSLQSRMEVGAGGHITFKSDHTVTNQGKITLGSAGQLRTIDLKLTDGRTLLGVYEVTGDELTVCFAEAGKSRPGELRPKGTQWAERWKRERL